MKQIGISESLSNHFSLTLKAIPFMQFNSVQFSAIYQHFFNYENKSLL